MSFRRMTERHIVVGDPVPDDVTEAADGPVDSDGN